MRILVDGQIVELREDRIWTLDELKSEAQKYEKPNSCKSLSSEEIVNTWDKMISNLRFDTAEEAGRFADCIINQDNKVGIPPSAKDILGYAGQDCDDTAARVRYSYRDIENSLRIIYSRYDYNWCVRFTANPYYVE